jgi:hypothetical protein
MKRQQMLTGVLTLGLLLLLALMVGLSQAQGPEPEAEAEPPVTALQTLSSMRVAGSALRPISSGVGFAPGEKGGCIYATSDADVIWNTPLYLPQGANVRYLRMYFTDVVTPDNCSGWLTAYSWTGSVLQVGEVSSSGVPTYTIRQNTVLISHTIDYEQYSYVLRWRPVVTGTGMQLCGLRVYYEPPPFGAAFMPIVTKDYHP